MVIKDKEEFEKWFEQAEVDLKTAKNSFKSKDYYASVFWCQQAVEKGLKAFWLFGGNELIRTHDLVRLGRKVYLPEKFFNNLAELSILYTEARYIPIKNFEREDVDGFIKFAKEVLEWIKQKI